MVFQSFEVQAYDYLVKPVDEKQFEKTMERLYVSMQNASEHSLLVQSGYKGRIIANIEYNTPASRKPQDHWNYAQSIAPNIFIFFGKILGLIETALSAVMFLFQG